MSAMMNRMKKMFQRKSSKPAPPRSNLGPAGPRPPLGPTLGSGAAAGPRPMLGPGPGTMNTITKPPPLTEDEDDDEDDNQSMGGYNVQQQTQMRRPQLGTIQSEDTNRSGNPYGENSTLPPTPMNPATSPFRNPSGGLTPIPRSTPMMNSSTNMTNPAPTPLPPFLSQIQDPSSRPPLRPVATTGPTGPQNLFSNESKPNAPMASAPSPAPPTIQPQSSTSFIPNPTPIPPAPPMNMNNNPGPIPLPGPSMATNNNAVNNAMNQMTPFRSQPNRDEASSRLEVDYPVESVLIDANIPSAVAIKINDAVERDRLGNPVHVHRYTFEPRSQEINYTDDPITARRSDGGFRRIREITPPSVFDSHWNGHRGSAPLAPPVESFLIHTDNLQTLQGLLGSPSTSTVSYPINYQEPVFYYTARALPFDPMRMY